MIEKKKRKNTGKEGSAAVAAVDEAEVAGEVEVGGERGAEGGGAPATLLILEGKMEKTSALGWEVENGVL